MATLNDTPDAADRLTYRPGRTLGQSGYIPAPADKMAERVAQLHALAVFVSYSEDGAAAPALLGLNETIVGVVLDLVADLAGEVHELHEQLLLEGLAPKAETQAANG